MTCWDIALSTGCFHHMRLADLLEAIAGAGFFRLEVAANPQHIPLDDLDGIAELRMRQQSLGLHCISVHAPFGPELDSSSPDPGLRLRTVAQLTAAADAAAILTSDFLVVHLGPHERRHWRQSEYECRAAEAAASVSLLVQHCRTTGVTVLLENMLPHLPLGGLKGLRDVGSRVPRSAAGICLDTGHAHLNGELSSALPAIGDRIRLIHLNDNQGDRDAHLPPGQGTINWSAFAEQLTLSGYRPALTIELNTSPSVAVTLKAAGEARRFILRLLEER
jgi:sugar phosphate isomerase/epimerase